MKLRRNLYALLGMAAWKFGKPYAKKKLHDRRSAKSAETSKA